MPVKIPIVETDKRMLTIEYKGRTRIYSEITQLDMLQLMSYIQSKNQRLYGLFRRLINKIDEVEGSKTNFERKLPRRQSVKGYD